MGRSAVAIELTAGERGELEDLAGRWRTAQGLARRARIVLLAAEGLESKAIAAELAADPNTVGRWRDRFAASRACTTSRGRGRPARSATTPSPRPSG